MCTSAGIMKAFCISIFCGKKIIAHTQACYAVTAIGNYLYAGTESGVWRRPLSDFPVGPPASVSSPISEPNALVCFPNPTTGQLHIESTSNDIVITDMLGRTRMRAVAGDGAIDVSGLPQGVYSISDRKSRAQFVKE